MPALTEPLVSQRSLKACHISGHHTQQPLCTHLNTCLVSPLRPTLTAASRSKGCMHLRLLAPGDPLLSRHATSCAALSARADQPAIIAPMISHSSGCPALAMHDHSSTGVSPWASITTSRASCQWPCVTTSSSGTSCGSSIFLPVATPTLASITTDAPLCVSQAPLGANRTLQMIHVAAFPKIKTSYMRRWPAEHGQPPRSGPRCRH